MSSNPSVTLSCLHPHAAANEAVTLLEGAVTVPANGGDLQGTGALALRWLPSTDLRLDADLEIRLERPASRRADQDQHCRERCEDTGEQHERRREGRRVVFENLGKRQHLREGIGE